MTDQNKLLRVIDTLTRAVQIRAYASINETNETTNDALQTVVDFADDVAGFCHQARHAAGLPSIGLEDLRDDNA